MTGEQAWAVLCNYFEAQDDLTDEECEAVDALHGHFNERSDS